MAVFFGNAKLIERYAETSILRESLRIDLHSFGIDQFKNFWLFGYGSDAFGQVFKNYYIFPEGINTNTLANRVHNDGIELLGEIGVLGVLILFPLFVIYLKAMFKNINQKEQLARFILLSLLLLIIFIQSLVDFSLHTPGISVLLMSILSIGLINFRNDNL